MIPYLSYLNMQYQHWIDLYLLRFGHFSLTDVPVYTTAGASRFILTNVNTPLH